MELLLAVALLVLLLGAVVFNFSGLQRGAQLDEGANQIEALVRFARAHAANSGRLVEISFEEDIGDGSFEPLANLRVLWEPDPVARPGVFEPLVEAEEYVRGIADLISIEEVRLVEDNEMDSIPPEVLTAPNESSEAEPALVTFPPIEFYPDGSCDSAEIVLASRSEEDGRRIALRIQGITGAMRRKLVADELNAVEPEPPMESGTAKPAGVNPTPQPEVRQ